MVSAMLNSTVYLRLPMMRCGMAGDSGGGGESGGSGGGGGNSMPLLELWPERHPRTFQLVYLNAPSTLHQQRTASQTTCLQSGDPAPALSTRLR